MKLLRQVLLYLLFIIVLAVPPWLLKVDHTNWFTPQFWLMFFFISALTFLVVIMVAAGQRKNPELGTQIFLSATVFKILACLIFMLIILHKRHVNKPVFAGNFAYIYFLNTVFEIYSLLCNLRNQNLR